MISEGLLEKPFIYECDLKQFFPSIKHAMISATLKKEKVPN